MAESSEPRVVLITGANRGIGLACVEAFLARGDRVAGTYRMDAPKKDDDSFMAVQCDVTSYEELDRAFTEVEQRWGRVEVVVANAGITQDGLMMRMSEESFTDVLDANLNGAFRTAKRAIGPMIKARSGRLIFISSVVALSGSAGQVNYSASKAGLIGLARSIARELASRNITANVVAPGPVSTDMTAALSDERQGELAAAVPIGRFASVEEIAAAVVFLASPLAGSITGAVIPVDGGLGMGH